MKLNYMSEKELQAYVLDLCRLRGVEAYHTYDSRRSEPGFPDLVLVGRSGVLYRELKSTKGRLSTDQERWLAILTDAGQDARVWRPDDWSDGTVLDEVTKLGRVRVQKQPPSQDEIRRKLARRDTSSGSKGR